MPKFHRKRHIEGIENSVKNDRLGNEKFYRKRHIWEVKFHQKRHMSQIVCVPKKAMQAAEFIKIF